MRRWLTAYAAALASTAGYNQILDCATPGEASKPALVHQSLRVYASVNGAELSYFHTQNGNREIDFILTRGAQTIAIEVKAAPTVTDGDVRHLIWLQKVMGERLADKLIITTGPIAYRRPDGVAVVPASLLGA